MDNTDSLYTEINILWLMYKNFTDKPVYKTPQRGNVVVLIGCSLYSEQKVEIKEQIQIQSHVVSINRLSSVLVLLYVVIIVAAVLV